MASMEGMKEVVKDLDLKRYMGWWYEIASIPTDHQPKNGYNTKANYALKEEGIANFHHQTCIDGKIFSMDGILYKADPKSDEAKFKFQFSSPVVGDYWVLHIDPSNYQYALIGEPARKYLWILCRQNRLDEEIYSQLIQRAKKEGYDVSKVQKTPQKDPPPVGEDGPKAPEGEDGN